VSDEQANLAIRRNPDYLTAQAAERITLHELRDTLKGIVINSRRYGAGAGSIDAATVNKCAQGAILLDDLLDVIDRLLPRAEQS
jgi:hypothetical protein